MFSPRMVETPRLRTKHLCHSDARRKNLIDGLRPFALLRVTHPGLLKKGWLPADMGRSSRLWAGGESISQMDSDSPRNHAHGTDGGEGIDLLQVAEKNGRADERPDRIGRRDRSHYYHGADA